MSISIPISIPKSFNNNPLILFEQYPKMLVVFMRNLELAKGSSLYVIEENATKEQISAIEDEATEIFHRYINPTSGVLKTRDENKPDSFMVLETNTAYVVNKPAVLLSYPQYGIIRYVLTQNVGKTFEIMSLYMLPNGKPHITPVVSYSMGIDKISLLDAMIVENNKCLEHKGAK